MAVKWKPYTDDELDRQAEESRKHSKILDPNLPRARGARYNRRTGRLEIELKNGCLIAIPTQALQGLRGAAPALIAEVEIWGDGYALHWEALDADFTVESLVAGRFGSAVWMREHARRAGSVKSAAKARAARRNGRKGGRPRKRATKG